MASRLRCVVTDVGNTSQLVGETGWVVPPSDSGSPASTLTSAIALPPAKRFEDGQLARK